MKCSPSVPLIGTVLIVAAVTLLLTVPALLRAKDKIPPDRNLDATAAADLLKANPDIIPLDIRTPREYNAGHLAKCTHVDFYARDFKTRVAELDREKPYLVYCAVGGRSSSAYPILQELGFTNLYHLRTGIRGWVKAGQPVEKD